MKIVWIILSVLLCFSCSYQERKLAYKSQRNLDEADIYLEHFEIPQALEKAKAAKVILSSLLLKDPTNTEFILLDSRANLTLFLSENAEVIETTPLDLENFIKLPSIDQYKEYDTLIEPTISRLKNLLSNKNNSLSLQQKASAHTLLASIWRLTKHTISLSKGQYDEAIKVNELWLTSLKKDTPSSSINKIENQIRNLKIALVEVELLDKQWQQALNLLEKTMGGSTLEYFRRNFKRINIKLVDLETKLQNSENKVSKQKNTKLFELLKKKKESLSNPLLELASNSVEENARIQILIDLVETQNNLIYRMICYYNLKEINKFQESETILENFYPELGEEVSQLFELSPK